jgi:two-component system chemotaxis sensor kinase CheA
MSLSLDQFRQTYLTECRELLAEMEQRLLAMDIDAVTHEDLNAIFRCAHSIKGGAGAFGFDEVTRFTHILETLLDAMREGRVAMRRPAVDALLRSVDMVAGLLHAADGGAAVDAQGCAALAEELMALSAEQNLPASVASQGAAIPSAGQDETCFHIRFAPHESLFLTGNDPLLIFRELARLGTLKVTADVGALPPITELNPEFCYLQWQLQLITSQPKEVITDVFAFVEGVCDLAVEGLPAEPDVTRAEPERRMARGDRRQSTRRRGEVAALTRDTGVTSIRVDLEKIDRLVNMVGELVITQAMLQAQTRDLPVERFPALLHGIDELAHHTRELQEAVMAVRMQPVKSIFARMPRIVHDIAAQLGKDIRLVTSGEETEVDKTIIEQLSDPLTHMIRNAADHGIEVPDVRRAAGKPEQGTIRLTAYHQGGRIVLEISDDGAGLNRARILAKAQECGLVASDASLSDEDIDQLIFLPGFSTAQAVSNISGRGVGMDVVKRNIAAMGGSVFMRSAPGYGSTFTVQLPLTLAILDGMIVRVGRECYIIPITSIIETLRPGPDAVRPVPGDHDVLNVRGAFVPVLYLHALFGVAGAQHDTSQALVVLVESGTQRMGLVVDELVGQQQVVIKSLEANAEALPGISGATILGDGKVSLILDVAGLAAMATPSTLAHAA